MMKIVTTNSMNKSNRWRVIDNLQTEEKRRKEKKNEECEGIFKAQNARGSKCSRCAAWSALFITKQAVITSKSFYHFAKVLSLLDAVRDLGGASSRWRELSIASTSAAPPPDLGTNGIFVTKIRMMFERLLICVFSLLSFFWSAKARFILLSHCSFHFLFF